MTTETFYFGYGSNLNKEDFDQFCQDCGFEGAELQPYTAAWLVDHKLQFHYYSTSRNGGAADIVHGYGMAVPGVLFRVGEAAIEALNAKEGHPVFYKMEEVLVCTPSLQLVKAITYKLVDERTSKEHIPPTKAYRMLIESGLKEYGLPTRMLDEAVKDFVLDENIDNVFVYGTLLQGQSRAGAMLSPIKPRSIQAGKIRGDLYDLVHYPGLRPGTGGVVGEMCKYAGATEFASLLQQLDGIEGHYGDGKGLYERVVVLVDLEDGTSEWAWTYLLCSNEFDGQDSSRIPSGSWAEHVQG
mmetsp:Transcript_12920/g.16776  ORF Transcript_12920/g.16776 Transcript_12920/m.16776 type:complete len:298 (+) Transcript_12920:169-1062(+)